MVFGEPRINFTQGPYKFTGLEEIRKLNVIVAPFKDVWKGKAIDWDKEDRPIAWEDTNFKAVANIPQALKELTTPKELIDLGAIGYDQLRVMSGHKGIRECVLINTTTRTNPKPRNDLHVELDQHHSDYPLGENIRLGGRVTTVNGNPVRDLLLNVMVGKESGRVRTNNDGMFYYDYSPDVVGHYVFVVSLSGDRNFNDFVKSETFNVIKSEKIDVTSSLNMPTTAMIGDDIVINGVLEDTKGNLISNIPLDLSINENSMKVTTNARGEWSFSDVAKGAGSYLVNISLRDHDLYNDFDKFDWLTVTNPKPIKKIISTTFELPSEGTVKVGDTVSISGVVTDEDKELVHNLSLGVVIEGVEHTPITDFSGKWEVIHTVMNSGWVNVTVSLKDHEEYDDYITTEHFLVDNVINKKFVSLLINAPESAIVDENFTVDGEATELDSGSPIANLPLSIDNSMTGMTSHVTTDNDGKYSISYTMLDTGYCVVTVDFLGNDEYEATTTNTVININSVGDSSVNSVGEEFDYSFNNDKLSVALDTLEEATFNNYIIPYVLNYEQLKMCKKFYHDKLSKMEVVHLYTPVDPLNQPYEPGGSSPMDVMFDLWKDGGVGALVGTPMESIQMGVQDLAGSTSFFAGFVASKDEGDKITYAELPAIHAPVTKSVYGEKVYYEMLEKGYLTTKYLDRIKGRVCVANSVTPSGRDLRIERVHAFTVNELRRRLEPFIGESNTPTTTYQRLVTECTLLRSQLISWGWVLDFMWTVDKSGSASIDMQVETSVDDIIHTINVYSDLVISDFIELPQPTTIA